MIKSLYRVINDRGNYALQNAFEGMLCAEKYLKEGLLGNAVNIECSYF